MKMLILNGSPKGSSKSSNTQIFINHFLRDMKEKHEVRWIVKEDPKELATSMQSFDTVLIVMPLYIHAMPSGVMKLIEQMEPASRKEQSIGFIIQAGFPESIQEKYIVDYLEALTKRLQYHYLGTVVKGTSCFIYRAPHQHEKLFQGLADLGHIFEETGAFDEDITQRFAEPYTLSQPILLFLKTISKLGLMDRGWKIILKENKALQHALDRPFL